jgi:parallel beta-helix repeat protein
MINVLDFGAKGDGITDNAAAFNAAIKAANGGPVYVPAGTYNLVDGTVLGGDLDCNVALISGTTLYGDGAGKTILIGSGTTSCNVIGAVGASNLTVRDMTVEAPVSRRNATMQDAVKFEACQSVTVARVDAQNLYMAIAAYGCQNVLYDSCTAEYNASAFSALDISIGTTVYTGTSDVTVTNCTASNNCGHGFRFTGLDANHRIAGFTVTGCSAHDNGEDGYLFYYLTASTISNSTAVNNGVDGFELCGTDGVTLDHCTASGQANPYCDGFVCDGDVSIFGPTSGNTISNSTASGNTYGYREWQGGAGNTLTNNNFAGNTNPPEYGAGTVSSGDLPY